MKFLKPLFVLTATVAIFAGTANAQVFDIFNQTRTLEIGAPQILNGASGLFTNGPVDVLGYIGRGQVVLNVSTNGGGTVTATLQTSADTTNWVNVANFAVISTPTTQSITNSYFGGTNLFVTDYFLTPFTQTTPTPSTAGYATTTWTPSYFTNSAGPVTVTGNGNPYIIGVNLSDNQRYWQVVWTATGAATNKTYVSALLQGVRTIYP